MHHITKRVAISLFAILAFALFTAESCNEGAGEQVRRDSVDLRNEVFAAAELKFPSPRPVNFPAREALVEYTNRQDRPNHPYYVYLLGENGNVINYFVSKTLPVNNCAFLSSTEDVEDYGQTDLITTAPSLDGIFYGGAGASAACDGLIIFDQVTDAMLIVYGGRTIVSDMPLKLDLKPIQIEVVGGSSP